VNELIQRGATPTSKSGSSLARSVQGGDPAAAFRVNTHEKRRRGIEDNLRTLELDTLAVVNLRMMRASGPDAFFARPARRMIEARDEG